MTIIHRPTNFIYLKSHKTASSSLEVYFVTKTELGNDVYATSKDVLKHGRPSDHRSCVVPGLGARWVYSMGGCERKIRSGLDRYGGPVGHIVARKFALREHQPGVSVRKHLGAAFFDKCFKVTSVRNPWDALVSAYEWRKSGRHGRSEPVALQWSDFLQQFMQPKSECGGLSTAQYYLFYPYLMIGDRWIADDVVYFEGIDESVERIGKHLGVNMPPFGAAAIHEKKVRGKADYRRYFTDEEAEKVADHFDLFLQRFPYRFDQVHEVPH